VRPERQKTQEYYRFAEKSVVAALKNAFPVAMRPLLKKDRRTAEIVN
jgi:hypothetical protein